MNNRNIANFTTTVSGIPCGVVITNYLPAKPFKQHVFIGAGPGDCDHPEEPEVEWSLIDSKGYFAAWLEAKLTSADCARIEAECLHGY